MRKREQTFEQRVLEELVVERLRAAVDFEPVLALGADLSTSIARVLQRDGRRDEVTGELVADAVRRGWAKLSEELLGELEARAVLGELGDCAMCTLEARTQT